MSAFRLALLLLVALARVTAPAMAQTVSWDAREDGMPGPAMLVGGSADAHQHDMTGRRGRQRAVAFDHDGNVYVVGKEQKETASWQMLVVSYDKRGLERWRRTRTTPEGVDGAARAVAVDAAGNVYVAGFFTEKNESCNGTQRRALISWDKFGTHRWTDMDEDCPQPGVRRSWQDIAVDASSNVYVTGRSDMNSGGAAVVTAKYTSTGTLQWQHPYNTNVDEGGVALALDAAGSVYVAAVQMNPDGEGGSHTDFLTLAYSSAGGALVWEKVKDGPLPKKGTTPHAIAVGGGRVYVTGLTADDLGGTTYFTVAYDIGGNEQWAMPVSRITGMRDRDDAAFAVAADSSGNAYVTGTSAGPLGTYDCYTVSYDTSGGERWGRATASTGAWAACYALALDASANVYVTGFDSTESGFVTASYTSTGTPRWQVSDRGGSHESEMGIALAVSGSRVYAAGSRTIVGRGEFMTVAYDLEGKEVWTIRTGPLTGYAAGDAHPSRGRRSVAVDGAGNSYVVGRRWNTTSNNYDIYTVSYAATGAKRWERTLDGESGRHDWGRAVTVSPGGHVIVTGVSQAVSGELTYLTMAYTSTGDPLWDAPRVAAAAGDAVPVAVMTDRAGTIVVTGTGWGAASTFTDDILTVAYDAAGNLMWRRAYHGPGRGQDRAADLALDEDGNVYVIGSSFNGSNFDYLTVSYAPGGTPRWSDLVDGGEDDEAAAVAYVRGYLVVTGKAANSSHVSDCLTVAYHTAGGSPIWRRTVGPETRRGRGAACSAVAIDSGAVYAVGSTFETTSSFLTVALSLDSGSLIRTRVKDLTGAEDVAHAVVADGLGNVFVIGETDRDVTRRYLTVAYNRAGEELWTHAIDGVGARGDSASYAAAARPGRGAVISGMTTDLGPESIRTIAYTFDPPVITIGDAISRSIGGTTSLETLGTVTDPVDPASLSVRVATAAAGITVTGLTLNSSRAIVANVSATCSATVGSKTLVLEVKNRANVTATANVTVNVTDNSAPTIGIYDNVTVTVDQGVTVTPSSRPNDNGTFVVTATASSGFSGTLAADSSSGFITVSNAAPGWGSTFTVTVTVTDNCGATTERTFQLTVTGLGAPRGVVATARSASVVDVSWASVLGAVSYTLYRRNPRGEFSAIWTGPSTAVADAFQLQPQETYVYSVVASAADGSRSSASHYDLATTVLFSDHPLTPGTIVRAVHVAELRAAVNAVRAATGQPPYAFTDPDLSGQSIRSVHLTELRSQLNAARLALGLPAITFTYPATASTLIRAVDQMELRSGVE